MRHIKLILIIPLLISMNLFSAEIKILSFNISFAWYDGKERLSFAKDYIKGHDIFIIQRLPFRQALEIAKDYPDFHFAFGITNKYMDFDDNLEKVYTKKEIVSDVNIVGNLTLSRFPIIDAKNNVLSTMKVDHKDQSAQGHSLLYTKIKLPNDEIHIFNALPSFNEKLLNSSHWQQAVKEIFDLAGKSSNTLLAGDFHNSMSTNEWKQINKGKFKEIWKTKMNNSEAPTFRNPDQSLNQIDFTFASEDLMRSVREIKVLNHKYLGHQAFSLTLSLAIEK